MVDPNHITDYKLPKKELEQQLIFWLLVAGKKASTISKRMTPLFQDMKHIWTKRYHPLKPPKLPLDLIKGLHQGKKDAWWLAKLLKNNGIGCYEKKSEGLIQLALSNLNLRTCSIQDLEKIKCIGRKTSRCFLLHSRPNAQCSGLDTHVLKCLKELGHNVPASSPSSNKKYLEIEKIFLDIVKKTGKTPAKVDLIIWRVYSSHKHLKPLLLKILRGKING